MTPDRKDAAGHKALVTRLRADLVVGGLWRGALVDVGGAVWPVVHADQYGEGWVSVATLDRIRDMRPREAKLILDDPLGLGLAGLAARVADRLGMDADPDRCSNLPLKAAAWWARLGVHDGVRDNREAIARASTYLALTDRLCAAVGLELAPGEVAWWESRPTLVQGRAEWFLAAGGQVRTFTGPEDWRAAIDAALEEVTRAT